MADQPGTFFERQGTSGLQATSDAFGVGSALGSLEARAAYVDEIMGVGPGNFPSAIVPATDTRIVILGCTVLVPLGNPAASLVTLQLKMAGNALLSIADGAAFQDVGIAPVPTTGAGVPFSVSAGIPSGAQIVSSPATGGPIYQIASALPIGTQFRAFVYVQAIRSGDVPTPC